jgi:hypothetical protein
MRSNIFIKFHKCTHRSINVSQPRPSVVQLADGSIYSNYFFLKKQNIRINLEYLTNIVKFNLRLVFDNNSKQVEEKLLWILYIINTDFIIYIK